jgi:hypothetical protein
MLRANGRTDRFVGLGMAHATGSNASSAIGERRSGSLVSTYEPPHRPVAEPRLGHWIGAGSGGRADRAGRRPGCPRVWCLVSLVDLHDSVASGRDADLSGIALMPNAVPVACSYPRCPGYAVPGGRGKCVTHRQTTGQRGYGAPHQDARERLAMTLPASCGYCGKVLRQGDAWVAAHRVDGHPEHGWMVACARCNEVNKRSRGGPSAMKRPPDIARSTRGDEVVGCVVRRVKVNVVDREGVSVLRVAERPIDWPFAPVAGVDARSDLLKQDDAATPCGAPARPTDWRVGRRDAVALTVDRLGCHLRATLKRAVSPLPHGMAGAPASECPTGFAASVHFAQVASGTREGADVRVSGTEPPRVVTRAQSVRKVLRFTSWHRARSHAHILPRCNERAKVRGMQVYRIGWVWGSKLAEMRLLADPGAVLHTYNALHTHPDSLGSPEMALCRPSRHLRHPLTPTLKDSRPLSVAWFLAGRRLAFPRCISMRTVAYG